MSTSGNTLANITGMIQLGLMVEGQVVPVIIGAVKDVKMLIEGETIEYTVAITTGKTNLDAAETNFKQALEAINTELVAAGKPPLPIPGQ